MYCEIRCFITIVLLAFLLLVLLFIFLDYVNLGNGSELKDTKIFRANFFKTVDNTINLTGGKENQRVP